MTDVPVMLITGTSRGIGRYLAEYYLDRGFLVVGCSRGTSDLSHERYRHHGVDVSAEAEVVDLFRTLRQAEGRLDVLINNAGIASMNHTLLMTVESVQKIIDTNFVGTFLFSREAAKLMHRRRWGRIVNMVTVATPLKLEGEAVYAASKAAVVTFTQILARELVPSGTTVNAVGSAPIATDLIRNVPQEKLDAVIRRQAIQRYGEFRDVSNVIDFFIRKESDFITGQTIYLGGV